MKLYGLKSTSRMTAGLLVALVMTSLTPSAQSALAGSKEVATASNDGNLRELQDQIRELGAALREMRTEVADARADAIELRKELGKTSDQLLAIKHELAGTIDPSKAQGPALPLSVAPVGGNGQQVESRVSKLEAEQQLLSGKVDDQYQTKVESGSKYRVRLSGMALINAFTTRGATDNFDLPGLAQARDPSQSNSGFGATLRQSIIGLDVFGPDIAGAKTSGDIRMDFFGGFPNTWDGVTAGLVRLRTGGLRLDWENTSIVAGQYAPFFSPLSPTSLASVAYPALFNSGNLWTWTPEIYVEHRSTLSRQSKLILQAGIMDPLTGDFPTDTYYGSAQAGERTGQPAYAGRLAWKHDSEAGALSVGAGGYFARQNWGFGRIVNAWAATADWSAPLSHRFSLSGEFYKGRAIGGLGAAEGQSVAVTGPLQYPETVVRGLNSTGGWAQLKFMPVEKLEFNSVFGEDFSLAPSISDSTGGGYVGNSIGRNQSLVFNAIYHLRSNLLFSVEYQRIRASQTAPGLFTANHVSLSAATLF